MILKIGGRKVDITETASKRNGSEIDAMTEEKKNDAFIQLTRDVGPMTLTSLTEKSPTSISVLMFLWDNMDDSHTIMVSQAVIAEALNKSRQTIGNAVKVLEEEQVIGIGKVGQANVYLINPQAAWRNGYVKDNTINFHGNVVLGKGENDHLFKQFYDFRPD